MQGPSALPLINKPVPLAVAAVATGIAVAAALSPWETTRIIGTSVLIGFSYGVVNNMIACRQCIKFYTEVLPLKLLNSEDPNLNALAWGAVATWHVSAIAGACLAFLARTPFPGLPFKITTAQLAPYLAVASLFALVVSHVRASRAKKESSDQQSAALYACSVRNNTGYKLLTIGTSLLAVGIIVARIMNRAPA